MRHAGDYTSPLPSCVVTVARLRVARQRTQVSRPSAKTRLRPVLESILPPDDEYQIPVAESCIVRLVANRDSMSPLRAVGPVSKRPRTNQEQ